MYAKFYNCDPLTTMKIDHIDKVCWFVCEKYQQGGSRRGAGPANGKTRLLIPSPQLGP